MGDLYLERKGGNDGLLQILLALGETNMNLGGPMSDFRDRSARNENLKFCSSVNEAFRRVRGRLSQHGRLNSRNGILATRLPVITSSLLKNVK